MSNYALAPRPRPVRGAVMLGDALNMRHPVTGAGMTVALDDARLLAELIDEGPGLDGDRATQIARRFYARRRPLAATLDMLAGALYGVFSGDGAGVVRMRDAMFRYWRRGGIAERGPMALLAGLDRRPTRLLLHYLAVASLGAGASLVPSEEQRRILPDVRGASQLLHAACAMIPPQIRRALTR
jgi:squalene monooxygenase